MALTIRAEVARPFRLRAGPDAAFVFLSDVPRWGALFPHVASIAPLPEALAAPDLPGFVWTMAPLGPPGVAVRTVYACRYAFDAAARTVTFAPVDGVGNARFEGAIALASASSAGTDGHVRLTAVLAIPAPAVARPVVEPAVGLAFRQMTATFLERLDAALGDGA